MASSSKRRNVPKRQPSRLWAKLVAQADDKAATDTLLPVDLSAADIMALEDAVPAKLRAGGRGQRTPPATPDLPVDTSGWTEFNRRYRVHGQIDGGGMARVLLARQHALARDVAVKVLQKDGSASARLLFRAEALVTAYLEHPNIVPVYDAADNCLVMRRVRGGSLSQMAPRKPDLQRLPQLVEIILRACDGIAFAHSRGIIHRDIKADNIMVGEFGEVLVVDWGLALAIAPGPDGEWHAPRLDHCPNVCAGTPGCVPPEIARGDRADVGTHTDLHTLGSLLYHMMTGHMPFDHRDKMEALLLAAGNQYRPLVEIVPNASPRLIAACQRAMSFLPEERGTITDFMVDLRAYLGRELVQTSPETGRFDQITELAPRSAMGSDAVGLAKRMLRRLRGG
jgi:serine/threonine protein kinase